MKNYSKIPKEEKIENIETVFMVSDRKAKHIRPYKFYSETFGCNMLAVFANRKNAKEWIGYWNNPNKEVLFDILERKLK